MVEVLEKEHLLQGLKDMLEWSHNELLKAEAEGNDLSTSYWRGVHTTYNLTVSRVESMSSSKVYEGDL